MKIGSKRKCDVCDSEIPSRATYRQVSLTREALPIFLNAHPSHQPRWQEVGDGTGQIRMDICLVCDASMGGAVGSDNDH